MRSRGTSPEKFPRNRVEGRHVPGTTVTRTMPENYSGVTYAPETPPSTPNAEAVMNEASSLARNATAAASLLVLKVRSDTVGPSAGQQRNFAEAWTHASAE